MSISINVDTIPKAELYYEKEKVCDMAFTVESRYRKAKTDKTKAKWWETLMKIIDVQTKFEKRLVMEFGYNH